MLDSRAPRWTTFLALLCVGMFLASVASALPLRGERADLAQPDGSTVSVRFWGDEYHQRLEDEAGYTLVRDPRTGWLCYAELDALGQLASTGVRASQRPPLGLLPGLREDADVVAARMNEAYLLAGRVRPGEAKADYPTPAVTGQVRGIALLVDFSDQPGEIDPAEVEAYLNEVGYTGNGNAGSVRDYYADISNGALDLTHLVTPYYYRAAHPKLWYEDPSQSPGWRARQLVTEAIEDLARRDIDFSEFDANGDGYIDLVSCFYAGRPALGHGLGLWPQSGEMGFQADGVVARLWHVTHLGDELVLGTAVHEIGHALCQWPDLYDVGFESQGVGFYCLMSNPVDLRNPIEPCGPLKYWSGWTETVLLDGVMPDQQAVTDLDRVFIVPHPSVNTELFVLENRRQQGRDASIPDEGLAVWHVDWRGSNNRESRTPDFHYMVTLVQADGRWDLENDANWGDDTDLFDGDLYSLFNPTSSPPAVWWRGQAANLFLDDIGTPGAAVSFDFRDGIGRWPLQLTAQPDGIDVAWHIAGAGGYVKTGSGTRLAHVPDEGSYVVTWRSLPGWQAPPSATVWVPESGPVPEVIGHYTHPPFAVTAVPAAAAAAAGRGGQALDYDDDGDLDLFLVREDEPNLLLRNDGGWQFSDDTPAPLAQAAATRGAAWADVDADGDLDVYLVRRGTGGVLLRQTAPGVFAAGVEAAAAGLDSIRAATWLDHDGDGRLDLHLVRDGVPDLVLRSPELLVAPLADYEAIDVLPGFSFARTFGGAWCDYDADGKQDLYMINRSGANVLAHNRLPTRFLDVTHGGLGLPWRDGAAAWGDHDNDGDFDLYVAQDGASDVLFTQYGGTFVMESEANTDTPGSGRDVVFADFDNDGDLDLFLGRNGQPDRLLMNEGEDVWRESPLLLDGLDGPTMAVIAGDLDGDGGVDLTVVRDGQPPVMLRNTMNRGHWLQVDAVGHGGLRDPVGAVMTFHIGDRRLLRQVSARSGPSSEPRRLHVGLGAELLVDSLSIRWPDGTHQVVREIAADQVLSLVQPAPDGTASDEVPAVTVLLPAWPNPFNPGTNLAFDLARPGVAELVLFDVRGRRVRDLHQGELPVGRHTFRWDGRDQSGRAVAAGVYLARLVADDRRLVTRLTLIR